MKTRTIGIFALALLSAPALFAQDLTGTSQGTLAPPNAKQELHTVIKTLE